jgi:hypothetical protein
MRSTLVIAATALVALMLVGTATAQVVPNPNTVTFEASPDHSAMSLDGITPLVTSYQLRVYLESSQTGTPLVTLDVGKPAPVAGTDGKPMIAITNAIWFAALVPKTRFVMKVAAVGASGEGVSAPSNPFGNVGPPAASGTPTVSKR